MYLFSGICQKVDDWHRLFFRLHLEYLSCAVMWGINVEGGDKQGKYSNPLSYIRHWSVILIIIDLTCLKTIAESWILILPNGSKKFVESVFIFYVFFFLCLMMTNSGTICVVSEPLRPYVWYLVDINSHNQIYQTYLRRASYHSFVSLSRLQMIKHQLRSWVYQRIRQ